MNPLTKQLMYFNVFKEIISIFGQMEIGNDEVDIEELATYLSSDKFFFDTFTAETEEEMQEQITELIENGFPIWRFLKCSDWTKNMVEKSFKEECEQEKQELFKTYKCLTCQYYTCQQTQIGLLQKCSYEEEKTKHRIRKREEFNLKKKCKHYIKRKEN
jgi:hypothetical protein